jgi:predicted cupin superfamily sugar epimerase
MIEPDGTARTETLGPGIESGESYRVCVRAGTWFAVEVALEGSYSLAGCTVAPGFDFTDFELGKREDLTREFPSLKELIARFT